MVNSELILHTEIRVALVWLTIDIISWRTIEMEGLEGPEYS